MDSFLPLLKKNALVGGTKASSCKEQDLKFRIDFDEVGAYVSVIDKQGQELEVDYHAYTGDTYQILRCIANILEEQSLHITWDKSDQRIYLHNNPYLLFMLTHCSNLVDNHLQPIGTTEESTHLQLVLNPIDGEIQPLLQLVTEADQRVIGVLSEEQTNAFAFLTDSFVLAGGTLYPVKPVGENFRQLVFFCSRFHQTQIEQYLSVFASYVEGVEIVYADYRTEVVQQGATSEPTLIFEKVDSDNALYLRLEYTLPGMSWDFLQHFDPTWAAHLTSDHRIVLQPIVSQSVSQRSEELRKFITSFSPTRAAAREVYVEHHNFFLIPAETAAPFLLTGLPSLISEYRLLGAEKLKEYKVKPVKPKLLMKMSSGIDFLEGDVTVQIEADTLTLKDMLAQYQKNKYIILSDGNRALLDEDYMKRLQRVFHPDKKKKVTLSFFDLPEVEQLLGYLPDEKVFKRHRDFYEGFNALSGQTFRKPKVKAKLRPYQQEGVKWMKYLYDNNLNGCLADDMGLGKLCRHLRCQPLFIPNKRSLPCWSCRAVCSLIGKAKRLNLRLSLTFILIMAKLVTLTRPCAIKSFLLLMPLYAMILRCLANSSSIL